MEIIAKITAGLLQYLHFLVCANSPKVEGFKQWMGDDSKALMKVYLPAITGLVPDQMVHYHILPRLCYIM
ncbi:hypothetical protein HD554DRAFT_2181150 [Boletus coccyginus]|nr:hypothetical protein HD554DRAFT_2181150 [Boletus coccyginus]